MNGGMRKLIEESVAETAVFLRSPIPSAPVDLSEQQVVAQAKRAMWRLKRHRADFAKVTAERIRLMEKFIANPRRNSSGMMRIILKPFDGL